MGEKRKQVDAKLFSAVKIMLNGGATYQEVAEFLQMGVPQSAESKTLTPTMIS